MSEMSQRIMGRRHFLQLAGAMLGVKMVDLWQDTEGQLKLAAWEAEIKGQKDSF